MYLTVDNQEMIQEIKDIILTSRKKVTYQVNSTMIFAYWNVCRVIVEHEQKGKIKAEYGKSI